MSDDDIRQMLRHGARMPRRHVDIAGIHRRGRRRRASVVGGGAALALALVVAVVVAVPDPDDTLRVATPVADDHGDSGTSAPVDPEPEDEDEEQPDTEDHDAASDDVDNPTPADEPAQEQEEGAATEEQPVETSPPATEPPPTTAPGSEASPEPEEDDDTDHGAPLWDRRFLVVAVSENGQPRPLEPDRRPWPTEFSYRPGNEPERQVGWRWGGCNGYGAPIEVSRDRLLLDGYAGTAAMCSEEENKQEEWALRFFASDPYWRVDGDRLWLWSGETIVELEEDTTQQDESPCADGDTWHRTPDGWECEAPGEEEDWEG